MKFAGRLAILLLILPSCYYSTTSRTAKGIKSLAVPFFKNETAEPNLEINVTERIIDNLVEDNTLDVVDEDRADAVLEGVIVQFSNAPFSFNLDLNAEEYHVVITVEMTLFNRRLNEPIWEKKRIKGDGAYFQGISDEGFTYDDALEEAIKEITDQVLNMTVQDW